MYRRVQPPDEAATQHGRGPELKGSGSLLATRIRKEKAIPYRILESDMKTEIVRVDGSDPELRTRMFDIALSLPSENGVWLHSEHTDQLWSVKNGEISHAGYLLFFTSLHKEP